MEFNEQLPEWQAEGTEPPASKKTVGWQPEDKPPAGYFNWLFNRTYKVLIELRAKISGIIESPEFTGIPKVPTAAQGTNTTQAANTAFVKTAIDNLPTPTAPTWSNITGKPSTFPPSTHTHAATEITATGSTNVQSEIDALKSSVSSGKNAVAGAITGMGQVASGSDTFAQMATKISAISTDATAAVGDVLAGKTFYKSGKKTGSMTDFGAQTFTPSASTQNSGAGYRSSITVPAVTFNTAKVLNDTTIAGSTGTMSNRAALTSAVNAAYVGGAINARVPQGGYITNAGAGYPEIQVTTAQLQAADGDLASNNIRNGVDVLGVTGAYGLKTYTVTKPTQTINAYNGYTFDLYYPLGINPIMVVWHPTEYANDAVGLVRIPSLPAYTTASIIGTTNGVQKSFYLATPDVIGNIARITYETNYSSGVDIGGVLTIFYLG
ncbi:hypothetical protein [Paenibacillus sp. SI8]|uniref:hypothetical protein n=1 Tax=unclassified Paenibacillus TaxID=185978 RepID=UPI0034679BC4